MYCKNCGQSLSPNAAFCGDCGTPVLPEEPSRKETKPRKKKERIPLKQELRKGWPLFLILALCCVLHAFPIYTWLFGVSVLSAQMFLCALSSAIFAYGISAYSGTITALLTVELLVGETTIFLIHYLVKAVGISDNAIIEYILSLIQIALCLFVTLILKCLLRKASSKSLKILLPAISGAVLTPLLAYILFRGTFNFLPLLLLAIFSAGITVFLYFCYNAKKEHRKNILLFLLPILYLVCNKILFPILMRYSPLSYRVVDHLSILLQSVALGAISYASVQKKLFIPLLTSLPCIIAYLCDLKSNILLLFEIPYPYVKIFVLLLPCLLFALLRKPLSKIIKPSVVRTLISALVIGCCADLETRFFIRKYFSLALQSYYSIPFGLITITTILAALLLHLICKERKTMTKNTTPLPPKPKEPLLCTICKNPLKDTDLFCPECGAPATQPVTPAQNTEEPENKNSHTCYNCGTPLSDGDLFCAECGAPVIEIESKVHLPETERDAAPEETPVILPPAEQVATSAAHETVICPACGNTGNKDEPYCTYCGTAFNQPQKPPTDHKSQWALLSQAQNATAKFMQKNRFLAWFSKYAVVFAMYFPIYLLLTKIESMEDIVSTLRNVYPIAFYAYFLAILSLFSHKNYLPILVALSMRFINSVIALIQQDDTLYCTLAVIIYAFMFWGVYRLFSKTPDKGWLSDSILNVKAKHCPLCGETIKNDDIFCPKCGNKL